MSKLLFVIALLLLPSPVLAANHAAVVLKKTGGEYKTACVSFDSATISGYKALQLAGWNPVLDNGFVVSIDGERAKANYEPGSQNDYWSYWQVKDDSWRYSPTGATSSKIADGAIDGWQRGPSLLALNLFSFGDICKSPIEVATPATSSASDETSIQNSDQATAGEPVSQPKSASPNPYESNSANDALSPSAKTYSRSWQLSYPIATVSISISIVFFAWQLWRAKKK